MDNVFIHKMNLEKALHCTLDVIVGLGYAVPVKRRAANEPGRLKKIKTERLIRDVFTRRFKRQFELLKLVGVKKKIVLPEIPEDEEFFLELIAIFFEAMKGGIEIFQDQISIGLDYSTPNANALKFARDYSYKLIKGIDETTRTIVSNAISGFVETPGFTIGDIIDLLEGSFGERRASMIAVTETTRAFAEGQKLAGEQLKKEFPDVKIVKKWYNNEDDRVCEICEGNSAQGWIQEDETFQSGDDIPPGHVNCRCFCECNTKL